MSHHASAYNPISMKTPATNSKVNRNDKYSSIFIPHTNTRKPNYFIFTSLCKLPRAIIAATIYQDSLLCTN